MKINICIVMYYELKEALFEAKKSLEQYDCIISGFPMYKFVHDKYDKREDYVEIFIDFINSNKIDVVLWWFINIDSDKFKYIKEVTGVKYIFFNWDEPFNWEPCDIKNKAPYIDCAFVTCKESLTNYTENGCKLAYNLPPAFSCDVNFPINKFNSHDYSKYYCDVNFCCTNLYDGPEYKHQFMSRKKLIDDIYNNQFIYGYIFHIYGPENFRQLYPESYRGFISYDKLNFLFNYSKINLCTHVISHMDGYINERVILVGGSGGLLMVDNVKGIDKYFEPNQEIILIDKNNYIHQICDIINNYQKYIPIKKKFHETCKKKYNYNEWAKFINEKFLTCYKNTVPNVLDRVI